MRTKGQAALSLVLLTGGIILVVGVTVAFLAYTFISSGFGFQASERAELDAGAGGRDALLRLTRDKDFGSAGYTLPITDGHSATVSVVQNSPVTNQITILSQATVSGYSRKVRIIVSVDATTAVMSVLSFTYEQL